MKDLNVIPEHLRERVVEDGADFGWPLDQAAEAIQVLVDAGAVVLGVEAWLVDEEGVPASVGWSSYDLGDDWDDWDDVVARAKVEAEEILAGVLETAADDGVNYVGVDWTFTPPEPEEEEQQQ
jgi:hypothetical protein